MLMVKRHFKGTFSVGPHNDSLLACGVPSARRSKRMVRQLTFLTFVVAAAVSLHACGPESPALHQVESLEVRRLVLTADDGKPLVELSAGKDGNPALVFKDARGQDRISLTVRAEESPHLVFYGPNSGETVSLGPLNDAPALAIYNNAGERRMLLTTNEDGAPHISLFDALGKTRAVLGAATIESRDTEETETKPVSSLVLLNKFGEITYQAPPERK